MAWDGGIDTYLSQPQPLEQNTTAPGGEGRTDIEVPNILDIV